jgi:hypothetical protein
MDENYGVRQEYRITVGLLRELEGAEELEQASSAGGPPPPPATASNGVAAGGAGDHLPFWVLPTKEVNAFAAAEMNRWLLCLEVLIGRVRAGEDGRPAASQEEQLINGVMVSAVVRVLRMSTGTNPSMHPSMWLGEWGSRKKQQVTEADNDNTDGEGAGEGDGNGGSHTRRGTKQFGLDLRTCVKKNGMAWFPLEPIHWNITPTFTSRAIRRLALASNAFQKSFHKTRDIQRSLSRENAMFELFRDDLRTSEEDGLHTGAQLVIRSYIQGVLTLLAERWTDGPKDPKRRLTDFLARAELEDGEAFGLQGLSWVTVTNLIGSPPRIVVVRRSNTSQGPRNGRAHFSQYDTGLWKDKVFALFAWDNERAGALKKRGWHNSPFRALTRQLHSIVVEEAGEPAGNKFLARIKDCAAAYLWAIPQYDYDKLSVLYKASKHHSQDTQEEISHLSLLERTNWLVPQMSDEYQGDFDAIQEHYSHTGRHLDEVERKAAQRNLWTGLHASKLRVYSSKDKTARVPEDPLHFGLHLELNRAASFLNDLNERIAEQEAESESEDDLRLITFGQR